ncbi:hypothetical protein Q8F55_000056 [Vanrija albida]|uniref:Uncharacterized protein n=1 Tax=Vanrija albida TaxID=181172 RepID=A0ABR3QCS9_9TREE
MPAQIDHTAFPDLMDGIVAAASPSVLLVLRSTSKEFQERVDRLLSHAALVPSQGAHSPVLAVPTNPGRHLPYLVNRVNTLDLMTMPPSDFTVAPFNRLHTIRRANGGWDASGIRRSRSIRTVVEFVDIRQWLDAVPVGMQRPKVFLFLSLPIYNLSCVIVHIKYDPTLLTHLLLTQIEFLGLRAASGSNFTIVLWPTPSENNAPINRSIGFLRNILRALTDSTRVTNVTVTIVGLESAPKRQRLSSHKIDDYRSRLTNGNAALANAFRLISLEQWWKELGDEKDTLGVWPQAALPPPPASTAETVG